MNYVILLITLISLIPVQSVQDQSGYPTKSGMIRYQYEGRTAGIEEIYFDDYGSQLYILKTVCQKRDGSLECDSILKILCSDTMMILNTNEHTAQSYSVNDTQIVCRHNIVSYEMLEVMGYFEEGTEKVSGVFCTKYSGENGTMWVWDNIILKSEMEIMSIQMKMEAVEVHTGIDVKTSKFKLPENYKLIN